VRHVAGDEDDLDGIGSDSADDKNGDKSSPLIDANFSDVCAEVAFAIL